MQVPAQGGNPRMTTGYKKAVYLSRITYWKIKYRRLPKPAVMLLPCRIDFTTMPVLLPGLHAVAARTLGAVQSLVGADQGGVAARMLAIHHGNADADRGGDRHAAALQ